MVESAQGFSQWSGDVEWRTWGDHTVVFHVPSGQTHLLDPVAFEGLRCLRETPLNAPMLASRMAQCLELAEDETLRTYARRLLERFRDAGLVEMRSDA